jgi:acetolactate synthase I/II/III large subunit
VESFHKVRDRLTFELTQESADDDGFPMKPQRIIHDVRLELDDHDVLVCDVGAHKMWTARHYPTYEPNTCIISNGFCSMAMALPGSIAAKLVHPDRRVLALQGDAGFMMNLQELATAVEHGVAAVQLIWEDNGLGLIEWKQMANLGTTSNTRFRNPDFVALAHAFGAHAERVTEPTGSARPSGAPSPSRRPAVRGGRPGRLLREPQADRAPGWRSWPTEHRPMTERHPLHPHGSRLGERNGSR